MACNQCACSCLLVEGAVQWHACCSVITQLVGCATNCACDSCCACPCATMSFCLHNAQAAFFYTHAAGMFRGQFLHCLTCSCHLHSVIHKVCPSIAASCYCLLCQWGQHNLQQMHTIACSIQLFDWGRPLIAI